MEGSTWTCAYKIAGEGPYGPRLEDQVWEGDLDSVPPLSLNMTPFWTLNALLNCLHCRPADFKFNAALSVASIIAVVARILKSCKNLTF